MIITCPIATFADLSRYMGYLTLSDVIINKVFGFYSFREFLSIAYSPKFLGYLSFLGFCILLIIFGVFNFISFGFRPIAFSVFSVLVGLVFISLPTFPAFLAFAYFTVSLSAIVIKFVLTLPFLTFTALLHYCLEIQSASCDCLTCHGLVAQRRLVN